MESKDKFSAEITSAADVIRRGGIILYPTDTIWGIGCDATNEEAVARVYALKRRADSKSMLALLDSVEALYRWVGNVPETALQLIDVAVSPLTIIYDSPKGVAPNLLADDGSLGIRIADDRFCKALCRKCRVPIVSTSANISGHPSAPFFADIEKDILDGVDHIVDLRRDDTTRKAPSGIIKVRDDETFTIIR